MLKLMHHTYCPVMASHILTGCLRETGGEGAGERGRVGKEIVVGGGGGG